jgi:hypothetical protein
MLAQKTLAFLDQTVLCLQFAARGAGAAAAAAGRRWAEQRGACQPPHFPSQQDGLTTAAITLLPSLYIERTLRPAALPAALLLEPWPAMFCAFEFVT